MGEDRNPEALVAAYREAFENRDVAACVEMFREDATIKFLFGVYDGKKAIETWHADRFAAGVGLVSLDAVKTEGDTVVVQAVATSRRLKFFRIDKVKGTIRFRIEDGRFREVQFMARGGSTDHLGWQFR